MKRLRSDNCKWFVAWTRLAPGGLFAVVVAAATAFPTPASTAHANEVMPALPGNVPAAAQRAPIAKSVIRAAARGTAAVLAPPRKCQNCSHDQCSRCDDGRCVHGGCRHGDCDKPGCPACCPVRPASYGFYDTQWRSWPGQGVETAAYVQPAPVLPPKSEVPLADEESPIQGFEGFEGSELPAPEPEIPQSRALPQERKSEEAAPAPLPAPATPDEPAKPGTTKDDNLFDEAALKRRSQERFMMIRQVALQQERIRREALRQQVVRTANVAAVEDAPASAVEPPSASSRVETPEPRRMPAVPRKFPIPNPLR